MKTLLISAIAALALANTAQAQQPAAPPIPTPAPGYGAPISLAQAKKLLALAESRAIALGYDGVVLAIVEPDGGLVAFQKMDNATYLSIPLALSKARTSALERRATAPGRTGIALLPDLTVLSGGLPIIVNGRTIGALGVSGADAPIGQPSGDVTIAESALALFK